jgi:hypothetical protein
MPRALCECAAVAAKEYEAVVCGSRELEASISCFQSDRSQDGCLRYGAMCDASADSRVSVIGTGWVGHGCGNSTAQIRHSWTR